MPVTVVTSVRCTWSQTSWTLGSRFQIPLEAFMYVRIYLWSCRKPIPHPRSATNSL